MNRMFAGAAALLLAAAAPAFAEASPPTDAPPPGAMGPGGPGGRMVMKGHGRGGWGGRDGVLSGLSPEGRKTLGEAMRETRRPDNDALDDARDKVLQLLAADRLDVAALRRAMGDEHRLGEAQQQRRQDAMLAAFQKLTPRDRQAFSVAMRNENFQRQQHRKDRDARFARMRERWGNRAATQPNPDAPPQQQR